MPLSLILNWTQTKEKTGKFSTVELVRKKIKFPPINMCFWNPKTNRNEHVFIARIVLYILVAIRIYAKIWAERKFTRWMNTFIIIIIIIGRNCTTVRHIQDFFLDTLTTAFFNLTFFHFSCFLNKKKKRNIYKWSN